MFKCPVCEFPELKEKPYDEFGFASFEICPSCGTEFGFDDFFSKNKIFCWNILRNNWFHKGMPWWSQHQDKPKNWKPELIWNK